MSLDCKNYQFNFSRSAHAESLLTNLNAFLKDQVLEDVILVAEDGRRVAAHRVILSAFSAYFRVLFTTSLSNGQRHEYVLDHISGDNLENLTTYCYTGCIDLNLDNAETLLVNASHLQIEGVLTACSRFLCKQIHPSNCLGLYFFAELYSCESLRRHAETCLCRYFMEVSRHQEFLELNAKQLGRILARDDLNVSSEEVVLEAVIRWFKCNQFKREQHIGELLSLVRMVLLKPTTILEHLQLIQNSSVCQKLVTELFTWHLLPEKRSSMMSQRTKPRRRANQLLAVSNVRTAERDIILVEKYSAELDKWTTYAELTNKRRSFVAAAIEGDLLIAGGISGWKVSIDVICFNLNTRLFKPVAAMASQRINASVCVLDNTLYMLGGYDSDDCLNLVECWNRGTNTWKCVAPMTTKRYYPGVAALNGLIYVAGGCKDGVYFEFGDIFFSSDGRAVPLSSTECYCPRTNQWTTKAALNVGRVNIGMGVLHNFLYAVGGYDGTSRVSTVERYDPVADKWTLMCSLSSGRDLVSCAVLDNYLIAAGGYNGYHRVDTVEQYDPDTDTWKPIAPLKLKCKCTCIVAELSN